MLIRNARILVSASAYMQTDLRVMHGRVQEIGAGLEKGLYEAEMDVQGDMLQPGRFLSKVTHVENMATLQRLCRTMYRQGIVYFRTDAPQEWLMQIRGVAHKKVAVPLGAEEPLPEEMTETVCVGTVAPLNRFDRNGQWLGVLDAHSGD